MLTADRLSSYSRIHFMFGRSLYSWSKATSLSQAVPQSTGSATEHSNAYGYATL